MIKSKPTGVQILEEQRNEEAHKRARQLWLDPTGRFSATCYVCEEEIPADATDWGFVTGRDPGSPEGVGSMYCCGTCKRNELLSADVAGRRPEGGFRP